MHIFGRAWYSHNIEHFYITRFYKIASIRMQNNGFTWFETFKYLYKALT